jgi:hydroxymethylglutaryl-CoA lyase
MLMPNRCSTVTVREVGLRDGLQSLSRTMPTAQKIEWLRASSRRACARSRSARSCRARLLPQLADTAELVAFARTLPGLTVSVLVPNLKGAERAIDTEAHLMLLPLSASHAHSLANLRKTPDDVLAELARIRDLRDARASPCVIEVGISTAFGCTDPGPGRARRSACVW